MKQSFSHGRSNTVVVEVKKRRILAVRRSRAGSAEDARPRRETPSRRRRRPSRLRPAETVGRRRDHDRGDAERLLREADEARMAALEEAAARRSGQGRTEPVEEKRRAEENRKSDEEEAASPRRRRPRPRARPPRRPSAARPCPSLAPSSRKRTAGATTLPRGRMPPNAMSRRGGPRPRRPPPFRQADRLPCAVGRR